MTETVDQVVVVTTDEAGGDDGVPKVKEILRVVDDIVVRQKENS